jgi:hypothetical protein
MHIEREAYAIRKERGSQGVKVLSDIDDTLYSSGGHFPAGCDPLFPPKVVYPGCLALYKVLDRGFDKEEPSCNIVFVSARPHVYKNFSEDKSYTLFSKLVSEGRLHNTPTLLPGHLKSSLWATVTGKCLKASAWKMVGEDKYMTYKNFRQLYREYDFIFSGDDGQGDLLAGQKMSEAEKAGEDGDDGNAELCANGKGPLLEGPSDEGLLAVLIHEVLPSGKPLALEPADARGKAWRDRLREQGVLLHRSYVGAAVDLNRCLPSLVSVPALRSVALAAIKDFDEARSLYSQDWSVRELDAATEALREDLARADEILQTAGQAPLPRLRDFDEIMCQSETASAASFSSRDSSSDKGC